MKAPVVKKDIRNFFTLPFDEQRKIREEVVLSEISIVALDEQGLEHCPDCSGSGSDFGDCCYECDGTGLVKKSQ
jgi:hypothetical protein